VRLAVVLRRGARQKPTSFEIGEPMAALSGTNGRRRIYLMRHGHVDYASKEVVEAQDATIARLTPLGIEQAQAAAEAFSDVELDIAVCSGLRRTRETASIVLAAHRQAPVLEDEFGLEELKSGKFIPFATREELSAYLTLMFDRAGDPDATFFEGGERFADAYSRAVASIESLLARPGWASALVVAHEGINRLLLGWMCGAGPGASLSFEQDLACVNVLDFDLVDDGAGGRSIDRKIIKAVNVTPYGWLKAGMHLTSFEAIFTTPQV
jgi:phosphoserine phosphatase